MTLMALSLSAPPAKIGLDSLGALTRGGAWRLNLPHVRPEHLLVWITRGQSRALLDGARRGVGVHNAIFLPAGTLFALDPGSQAYGQAVRVPPGVGRGLPDRMVHLRIRDTSAQFELTQFLEAMGREQSGGRKGVQAAMAAWLDLAAIWLARQDDATEPVREDAAARLMRAFARRLATGADARRSLAEHADALGVTPTHLTRTCRAQTGRTASALMAAHLLHEARRLLLDTALPAQEIARSLGFSSTPYFARFVQRHTGLSPTALRGGGPAPVRGTGRSDFTLLT